MEKEKIKTIFSIYSEKPCSQKICLFNSYDIENIFTYLHSVCSFSRVFSRETLNQKLILSIRTSIYSNEKEWEETKHEFILRDHISLRYKLNKIEK